MKRTKKNNKGFSLVELIVVVLIMAIIAVALAPQIMKWVNKSRVSADISTYDSVVSNAQTALTEEEVWNDIKDTANLKLTITNKGLKIENDPGKFTDAFLTASGLDKTTDLANSDTIGKIKFKQDITAVVTIKNGNVERTTPVDDGSSKASGNN